MSASEQGRGIGAGEGGSLTGEQIQKIAKTYGDFTVRYLQAFESGNDPELKYCYGNMEAIAAILYLMGFDAEGNRLTENEN